MSRTKRERSNLQRQLSPTELTIYQAIIELAIRNSNGVSQPTVYPLKAVNQHLNLSKKNGSVSETATILDALGLIEKTSKSGTSTKMTVLPLTDQTLSAIPADSQREIQHLHQQLFNRTGHGLKMAKTDGPIEWWKSSVNGSTLQKSNSTDTSHHRKGTPIRAPQAGEWRPYLSDETFKLDFNPEKYQPPKPPKI